MIKRQKLIISIAIIIIIFSVGFFPRWDSTNLSWANQTQKIAYTDDSGLPYMYELDSYYNYRLTENFLKNGHFGDTIKNNQSWDSFSYSPPGRPAVYPPLIVWLAAFSYWFVNLFTSMTLLDAVFWIPLFISPLAGIVGYVFVRKYAGEYAGLVSGILLVTAPLYVMRTLPGFFDTDMFNIILPILTILFFSEAIETPEKRNMIIFAALSAFSLLLFSMAWTGWSYLFYIMFFTGLIYIILCKMRKIKFKKFLEVFFLFTGLSLVLIAITSGIEGLLSLINYPLSFFTFLPGTESIGSWPNIYESVGELQKPDFDSFISKAGPVNLGLGIFGIFVIASIMLRKNMRTKYLPDLSWYVFILIFVWIFMALMAYSSSVRFGMLVIAPLAVFSGILVGVVINYLDNFSWVASKKKKKMIISIFLVMIICIPPVINMDQNYSNYFPGVDDDIMSSALWIKSNTTPDTVIISDWSYGHFFTAFSDRPVLFDGGSQNTPRAYWVFKAFATDNETLSAGIFRMISTSGDESFTTVENYTKNTSITVEILNNILGIPKDDARSVLKVKYNIDPVMAEKILNYTHSAKSRPFVVFTNNDMIYGGQWNFVYGDWNFNNPQKSNYTYSGGNTNSTGEILNYSNGVILNLKDKKATWNQKSIYSAIIVENNTNYKFLINNKSNYTAIFLMKEKRVVVIDKKYQDSLFIKMVFLKTPTKLFRPVYKNKSTIIWSQ